MAKGVSTASDEDPAYTIEPHNEMAYYSNWPNLVFLYCHVPPAPGCGGESGITDVRKIYAGLDQEVKDKLIEKGIRYHVYLEDRTKAEYISWQSSFQVETREEVEKILTDNGNGFAWDEDGSLTFWRTAPAMIPHWQTAITADRRIFSTQTHNLFQLQNNCDTHGLEIVLVHEIKAPKCGGHV